MPEQEDKAQEAQRSALADWQAGRVGNEFYDKVHRRDIASSDVERVLASKSSGIWRYRHALGQVRYGFWHPVTRIFIVWQPDEEGLVSQIKTAFSEEDGVTYASRMEDVESLRLPRSERT